MMVLNGSVQNHHISITKVNWDAILSRKYYKMCKIQRNEPVLIYHITSLLCIHITLDGLDG